jgi:phage terminase large subunit-like protein
MADGTPLVVTLAWIEAHAVIPDGFRQGEPFEFLPWQLKVASNFYTVRHGAEVGQRSTAFVYRRAQVIMSQKSGKGPFAAAIVLAEAAGPTVFAGFAEDGDRYRCRDHGCPCGWFYDYAPGEPMAVPQPTPLIQLLATSEDQVANVYRPLTAMVKHGTLGAIMSVREGFIRVGDEGRIDVVTSSAQSRLGNPITFAIQDETGTYTATNKMIKVAETMRRGLAGMSGRSMETTNAYDPSEESTAKRTHESKAEDVYRYFPQAPLNLSYRNKQERRKIHKAVYCDCPHIDLDAIEAEASELAETDPAQAERFFGNRIVAGAGAWVEHNLWEARANGKRVVKPKTPIVLGFDGSDVDDWTAFRAETLDGFQFTPTYGPNKLPTIWNPADFGGQVPRLDVSAALDELVRRYDVKLIYADPPYWDSEVDQWAAQYGDRVVISWYTRRVVQMHAAAERLKTDISKADTPFSHDGCPITSGHIRNARAAARPQGRYVLAKAAADQKIDVAVTSILAHEAAMDAVAAGMSAPKRKSYYYGS